MKKSLLIEAQAATGSNGVAECVNLRPDPDGAGYLRPCGMPLAIGETAGELLHSVTDSAGTTLFLASATRLTIVAPGCQPYSLSLPDKPTAAADIAGGRVMVMTPSGALEMHRDPAGRWTYAAVPLPHSPLALAAVDSTELTAICTGFDLSTVIGQSTTAHLSEADLRTLGRHSMQAYTQLAMMAAAAGESLQPRLGQYRLLDSSGHELYRSCPVLLGASAGVNCLTPCSAGLRSNAGSSQYEAVSASYLSATPYSVVIRLNSAAGSPLLTAAAMIEVWLSPQIHPTDGSMLPAASVRGASLQYMLPGTSSGMNALEGVGAPQIEGMLARLDSALHPVARIALSPDTFASVGATVRVECGSPLMPSTEQAQVRSICSQRVADGAAAEAERCRAPHRFSAGAGASAGGAVVWGDITPALFDGYSGCEMARDVTAEPADVVATVEMPGELVARVDSGLVARPLTLSPLVCYPLTTATCLTVAAATAEEPGRRLRLPLRTLPGARYAFYLDKNLRPIALSDGKEVPVLMRPAENRIARRYAGMVLTASADTPTCPVATATVSPDPVRQLLPGVRTTAGWNFSQARYYAVSDGGVYSLNLNSRPEPGAVCLLLRQGVRRAFTAAQRLMVVTTAGELIAFDGGKATTVATGVADAGYTSARHGEVWALSGDGRTTVYPQYAPGRYSRCDDAAHTPASLISCAGGVYGVTATGTLLDLNRETSAGTRPVAYSRRVHIGTPGRRVCRMDALMQGSSLNATLTLSCDGGGASLPIVSLAIDGAVNEPVAAVCLPNRRPYRTVSVRGEVAADFTLTSFSLNEI